jgi:hypothetical protein
MTKLNWNRAKAGELAAALRNADFYCPHCDRWLPHRAQSPIHSRAICKECVEHERNEFMAMDTRPGPVAPKPTDIEYDSKILWELFLHNKGSTLDYGWLRNRVLRTNGKMTNDRQNAALAFLESTEAIEKVSRGRWRYKKPRPSATVVASAPATEEEAAQVIPRFPGAMTDLVYSLLRERLPDGLTSAEIQLTLGIDNVKDRNNMSAGLQSLERMGWMDVDRTNPRKQKYFARVTNKLGKPATQSLRHASAPPVTPPVAPIPAAPTSPAPAATPPADVGQAQPSRVFTLEQVRRYGELKDECVKLRLAIPAEMRDKVIRLLAVETELRDTYGEG